LFTSVVVSMHIIIAPVPHTRVCGAVQTSVHAPATHVCVPGHWLPHMPQLCASVFVSVHTPPHECIGTWHVHWPAAHETPVGHTLPQLPQFMLSAATRVHTPLQLMRPASHETVPPSVGPASMPGPM
jgi:hypothetical protein